MRGHVVEKGTIDHVRTTWDVAAESWSTFVRGGEDVHREDIHGPALLAAARDVRGLRLLDVGCGEGWCSREMARGGAAVVGIDVSEALVALARDHRSQASCPIEYHVMDAIDVDRRDWCFDVVSACMALHCMPDPGTALRAIRRALAPDGRLVFSIPHPAAHPVASDARSEPEVVEWAAPRSGIRFQTLRWRRSETDYERMLVAADFRFEAPLEPRPTAAQVAREPRLDKACLPRYLIYVASPGRMPA
jgi:2-polyprenyl-3-methyl-5-hydroxy-6-metoxy-1,4-benzoquinol methylase